jgi:hypothetical protein
MMMELVDNQLHLLPVYGVDSEMIAAGWIGCEKRENSKEEGYGNGT